MIISVGLAVSLGDGNLNFALKPESLECARSCEVFGWKTRWGAFPIPLHVRLPRIAPCTSYDTWHLAPRTSHLAPRTWHLSPGTWHLALQTLHFLCLLPGALGHQMSYKSRSSLSFLHLPLIKTSSHLTTELTAQQSAVWLMPGFQGMAPITTPTTLIL